MAQNKKEQFLLLRIRAFQDKDAFKTLLNEHSSAILKFLHLRLPSSEDAQDAYSTICLRVWEYASGTEVKHFSGLLFTIARSVIATFYHERSRKPTVSITYEDGREMQIPSHETVEKLEAQVDAKLMQKMMKKLSDDDREVIILRHLEGYSIKEIAAYLGKTSNATSMIVSRAVERLKKLYEGS